MTIHRSLGSPERRPSAILTYTDPKIRRFKSSPRNAGKRRCGRHTNVNHDVEGNGRTAGGLLFVKGLHKKSWKKAHSQPRHGVCCLDLFAHAGSFIASSQNVHIGLVALM